MVKLWTLPSLMNVVVNMDNIFKNNIQTLKKINKLKFSIEIAIGKKIEQ